MGFPRDKSPGSTHPTRSIGATTGPSEATMTSEDQHPATRTLVVAATEAGERLDRVLANHVSELSRSRLKALILAGQVTIGGEPKRDPGHHVRAGEEVRLTVPPPEP